MNYKNTGISKFQREIFLQPWIFYWCGRCSLVKNMFMNFTLWGPCIVIYLLSKWSWEIVHLVGFCYTNNFMNLITQITDQAKNLILHVCLWFNSHCLILLVLLCAQVPSGTDIFRPYFSEHVKPNTATAAGAAVDGGNKPLEFSHALFSQANSCDTKIVRSYRKEMT